MKAWIELNDMIFVCKRYEGMNREIHGQVTRDISYLVEQIDDLYRMESEATSKADLAMQARPGSYSDQSA